MDRRRGADREKLVLRTQRPERAALLALIRHSDDVLDTLLLLAGRRQIAAAKKLIEMRNALAETVERIDLLMERQEAES